MFVSSARYHGKGALTYGYEQPLGIGSIVVVPMQRQNILGVIVSEVDKPAFATKPISRVIPDALMPPQLLALVAWLRVYYPAPMGQLLSMMLPATLLQTSRKPAPAPIPVSAAQTLPTLTAEQESAASIINKRPSGSFLLHGDTGTGKTRVYLELAKEVLKLGKSVVVLTPEIGLTPQLVDSFERTYPGQIRVLHSNLTPAERRKAWLAIAGPSEPQIVIGPRSALFSPLSDIGLIILDEAHDSAYKQEQTPYYQTTRVAAKLGELHKARVLLGTATPLVTDYYAFKSKQLPIIRMSQPALPSIKPTEIKVVDLRQTDQFTRSPWLSDPLLEAVSKNLNQSKQSLLFLNRRGTARLVLCQTCGWEARCPKCDLPLTYHGDSHHMQCHTCGFSQSTPATCPECQGTDILFKSIGTKSLIDELHRLFPKARLARFDSDTKKPDRLETQYDAIHKGEVDILVGTQMLGKGLDLPKLELVAMIAVDTSLSFPDYTAEERTFQLILQLMGRVNRGHGGGTAIIQTYHPDSLVINSAISNDYEGFYEQQINQRQQFNFPPFVYMLKLKCGRASRSAAKQAAEKLADSLAARNLRISIIGPAPAFLERNNDRYYWQIIIAAKRRDILLSLIHDLPANWQYDIDPANLL